MPRILLMICVFAAALQFVSCCCDNPSQPTPDPTGACALIPGGTGTRWVYIDSSWRDGVLQPVREVEWRVTGSTTLDGRVLYRTTAVDFLPGSFTVGCDTAYTETLGLGGHAFLTPVYLRGGLRPDTFMTLLGDVGVFYAARISSDTVRTAAGDFTTHTRISSVWREPGYLKDETDVFPGLGIIRREYTSDTRAPYTLRTVLTLKSSSLLTRGS